MLVKHEAPSYPNRQVEASLFIGEVCPTDTETLAAEAADRLWGLTLPAQKINRKRHIPTHKESRLKLPNGRKFRIPDSVVRQRLRTGNIVSPNVILPPYQTTHTPEQTYSRHYAVELSRMPREIGTTVTNVYDYCPELQEKLRVYSISSHRNEDDVMTHIHFQALSRPGIELLKNSDEACHALWILNTAIDHYSKFPELHVI